MECYWCDGHQTHNHQLLTSLRELIVDKPPYISGTLQLPDSFFTLFYKAARDGNAPRWINLANAIPDELEQLTQACEVFDVLNDEAYCTLGPSFTDLIKVIRGYLEDEESTRKMEIEAYKLNIYSKGSFFKLHVDTPPSKKIFGSLVIVFPTHHEGGALFLRHRGREWIFDPGQALAGGALERPSIGYVAFLNDIEQNVAPVTSGHCVTLTYNLYFDDDGAPVPGKDAISEHLIPPKPPNQHGFREDLKALLENPEFMAEGGTLAFGLRHGYPIKHSGLQHVRNVLKGSDAVVWQSALALGFEPMLYMYYGDSCGKHEGMVTDKLVNFDNAFLDEDEDDLIRDYIQGERGISVCQDGGEILDAGDLINPEPMEWVTPITAYNRIEGVYTSTGNPGIYSIDGDACMIVRIGKVGNRLVYPTAAQIEKAYKQPEGGWW